MYRLFNLNTEATDAVRGSLFSLDPRLMNRIIQLEGRSLRRPEVANITPIIRRAICATKNRSKFRDSKFPRFELRTTLQLISSVLSGWQAHQR
jgi:hypothetical protein